jgi:hypothetical protein
MVTSQRRPFNGDAVGGRDKACHCALQGVIQVQYSPLLPMPDGATVATCYGCHAHMTC